MSTLRLAGMAGLLVAAALVGGTIIGSVAAGTMPHTTEPLKADLAAPSPNGATAAARIAAYCADFRKAFAADLGVPESALAPAAKKAAIATIDAAVASGELPKKAGDRLTARIEAADADTCALLAGRIGAAKASGAIPKLGIVKDGLSAAAKTLGVTTAELGADLRSGKTLKGVAEAKRIPYETVSAAVLAAVKSDLDVAVTAGTIKQARADRVLDRVERNLAEGRLRNAPPQGAAGPAASAPPTSGS